MRGKVKIFGLERALIGPSHHNKVIRCSCRHNRLRDMRLMGIRDRRMTCRHKECIPMSRRTTGALKLTNIRCRLGCCRRLGCKGLIRSRVPSCIPSCIPSHRHIRVHRVHRCRHLGCTLQRHTRVHHIQDQSSKFHASRSFSRLHQQRRLRPPTQRRTMQSKLEIFFECFVLESL